MGKLEIGCTLSRHKQIGVNAVIDARGGMQALNDLTEEDISLRRDKNNIRNAQQNRVRFYQFNSKFFRRNIKRVEHLLSTYED